MQEEETTTNKAARNYCVHAESVDRRRALQRRHCDQQRMSRRPRRHRQDALRRQGAPGRPARRLEHHEGRAQARLRRRAWEGGQVSAVPRGWLVLVYGSLLVPLVGPTLLVLGSSLAYFRTPCADP